MRTSRRWFAGLTIAAAVGGVLWAQPYTSGPITEFRRTVFNRRDFKMWDVRGSEARFRDAERIDLTKLHVTVFTGDATEAVDIELYTPQATVDLANRGITGPGLIHVVGRGVELLGEDWSYAEEPAAPPDAPATKVFIIRRNAVVKFAGDLGNILQ